jgi:hypothetical protein
VETCKKCNQPFPFTIEYFASHGRNKDGSQKLRKICKTCQSKIEQDRRANDLETYRERDRKRAQTYQWRFKNPEKWRDYVKRYQQEVRRQVLEAYGNECSCCHETELRFLTIEHQNHDGKAHRKRVGNTMGIYHDLRRRGFPKDIGITLFCWNCNLATAFGKQCPHQENKNASIS